MRILLINWQDRENPEAGGAEIHLHELFGRLAGAGHGVTMLCGGWHGAPATVNLDGMSVHRVGTRYTFPFLARRAYRERFARAGYDVLIEDINKVPLYTPRWGARNTVAIVPHLFGGTAFQELPAPLAAMVWLAERPIPQVYRDIPFQVISQSTADDLVERGLSAAQLRVIYVGIDTQHYVPKAGTRSPRPVFSYLGRLKKYKRVDLVIRAFAQAGIPEATLEIAGSGDYRGELERLSQSLDLADRVRFLGRVNEDEKLALLRRSWALAFTSPKEGWGITNLEAAACGTPVIASNSPGIRESVRDGETGFLVPHGDIEALATAMRRIAASPELVHALGAHGREFARSFTWENAAAETTAHLMDVLNRGG